MGYGNDWDPIWAQQQRICSHEYFQRYFTYSVPPGDIGDGEVARFLDALSGEGLRDAHPDALIVEFAERRAITKLVEKLRSREEILGPRNRPAAGTSFYPKR
jgi:hypothetical protein